MIEMRIKTGHHYRNNKENIKISDNNTTLNLWNKMRLKLLKEAKRSLKRSRR